MPTGGKRKHLLSPDFFSKVIFVFPVVRDLGGCRGMTMASLIKEDITLGWFTVSEVGRTWQHTASHGPGERTESGK